MEFLKNVFQGRALTFDAFSKICAQKKIQLADAAQVEQLQKERGQLEKQLYRARATGDGYAQIRFRTLLEQNREALEKLIPKQ